MIIALGMVAAWFFLQLRPRQIHFSEPSALENALVSGEVGQHGDVPGRDLRTVPRYLPSVRIFFSEEPARGQAGKSYLVMYRCQGSLQQVSAYYETELPKYGWRLATKDEAVLHMDFVRVEAKSLGPPMVQISFRPISTRETAVSVLAVDQP